MIFTFFYRIKGMFYNIGASWDKLAPDKENAVNFALKNINEEPKRYIETNIHSMEYCLAHYGENINKRYRQDAIKEDDQKIADRVATNTTAIDLVLYRGVGDEVYKLMKSNAKDVPNCDLYEKSFLATSLVKGCESNCKIKLRIYVPAGTKCVYLGNVNDEQHYYEVDVMHGSRLKIESIDSEYINCRLLKTA